MMSLLTEAGQRESESSGIADDGPTAPGDKTVGGEQDETFSVSLDDYSKSSCLIIKMDHAPQGAYRGAQTHGLLV